MTIIKRKTVEKYISLFPTAKAGLRGWLKVNQKSTFNNIMELRKAYPTADSLKGTDYICINIKGNDFRLIVRYTWGKTVFIIDFLPHAEYTKKYC